MREQVLFGLSDCTWGDQFSSHDSRRLSSRDPVSVKCTRTPKNAQAGCRSTEFKGKDGVVEIKLVRSPFGGRTRMILTS